MICEHGADAPKFCAICRHQGIMGKDEGITLAKDSQLNWHNEAVICIRQMARTGKPFTAEDVVNEIGAPGGSGKVIGAAFNTVARSGMIWRCGERPADRKSSHRRMLAVWRGGQVQEQTRWAKMNEYILILTVVNTLLLSLILLKTKAGEDVD